MYSIHTRTPYMDVEEQMDNTNYYAPQTNTADLLLLVHPINTHSPSHHIKDSQFHFDFAQQ